VHDHDRKEVESHEARDKIPPVFKGVLFDLACLYGGTGGV